MPKDAFSAEELTLLDAIHGHPPYDRPRLSYADCLVGQGLSNLC
jgi:uncharacterized protein (TIGR02996 family)